MCHALASPGTSHTPVSSLPHFQALRQSYTRQLFWLQTPTEIIIHLPQPVYSFLSRRRIILFASLRKGWNLCHFPLVMQWILERTSGTHSTVSWRSILRNLKTWIYDQSVFSTLFLVFSIATKTSFFHCLLIQTPSEPTALGRSSMSHLWVLCPWNSCGVLPCSFLAIIGSQSGLITLMEWERWPLPEYHGTQVQTDTSKEETGGRGTNPSTALQPQVLQRREEMHHMQQDPKIPALAETKEFCCSEQLLNHSLPKPAVGLTVTPGSSPVHLHVEVLSHSCGLKVSTGDFYIHFRAGPHCQMFSMWLWSKLSLALINPIDAVSFSKAHVYRDLLGT